MNNNSENQDDMPSFVANQNIDELLDKNPSENKNKLNKEKVLIIIAIISVILIITILIITLALREEKDEPEKEEPEIERHLIDYEEAKKLVDPKITEENHNFLLETINNLDELMPICKNITFPELNVSIGKMPENIDLLINNTNISLLIAKEDLELYISHYANFSDEINNLTKEISKIMMDMYDPLDTFKKEIDNLSKQFERNIQNLAMPLLINDSNSVELRSLGDNEILKKYNKEIKKLNKYYNRCFWNFKKDSKNISAAIKGLPKIVNRLLDKVGDTISYAGNIIKNISFETKNVSTSFEILHTSLIKIKIEFISFHKDLTLLKNELNSMGIEISVFVDSIQDEETEMIGNIKNLASQLRKNIINILPIILDFFDLSPQKIDIKTQVIPGRLNAVYDIKIGGSVIIALLEFFMNNEGMFNIESSTSLDLLFIVDTTGSMEPYLEKVKQKMINIISGIVDECPGIDINLGFIGYKDFYELSYDIGFTKDHTYLKKYISGIYAFGGATYCKYYPDEDVALGLELALKKDWKSNAKLAVFIADASGHGEKYGGHNTKSSDPKRREIDEMIEEMANKNIFLFCLNITNKTDKMFKIFQDIYNVKKEKNLFQIINMTNISFADIIVNYAIKVYLEQRQNKNDRCLLNKKTAIEVLKNEYGIDNKNPDDNLRFILGKCSPVLLVPGIYSTKLKVEFNCKGLATEEKDTTLKNIRIYCGDNVCKDESKTSEEYPLLFAIGNKAFGIDKTEDHKYGECLGHIATYFQNENECPKVGNKNTCFHSKFVKVGYYGGTTNTLKESRCGVEGIINVAQTGRLYIDSMVTFFAKSAKSFYSISKNLIQEKYKEGFSLAALPNDYRRYLASNNFATKVFKSQINRLYENTGKPVVIIAHSFGTLLTLTNLLKNEKDKEFLKKIKKFIAIAPPFAGSAMLLDTFLHTTKKFDNWAVTYPYFGQNLLYRVLPTIMELRPLPMASKIFTDKAYEELGNALRDRLEIERDCKNKNCDISEIEAKSKKFDDIFNGYFPSLLDSECKYELFDYTDGYNKETFNRKCYTNIYNVGDCPTIITKSVVPNEKNFEKDLYCNKYGNQYFYQGECNNKERYCLDEIYYSNHCPNVYSYTNAVDSLIERFNNNFSAIYGQINKKYFDNYETIRAGIKNSIEYQKKIDLIKELPVPPVDTELVYASYYPTIAALVLDDLDFTREGKIFVKGGDDTVPAWSSLLTGLKWIYDKKKNNLSQNIKLIEYCSRLAKNGKYKYEPNKEQNFGAISCSCLDKEKNLYKKGIEDCSHGGMLNDENLLKYLYSVVNDPKETIVHTDSKKKAAKKYDKSYDYVGVCNKELYDILQTAK